MITKYSINLRQFNNGESDKITFPTFEQCLMYGMHKLKKSFEAGKAIVKAITIEDNHDRKIVIAPSEEEMESLYSLHHGRDKDTSFITIKKDFDDEDRTIIF